MVFTSCNTLQGKVTAVEHSALACRVTIELAGTPGMTAAIMKEAAVEMGLVEGQDVRVEVEASRLLVGVGQDGR